MSDQTQSARFEPEQLLQETFDTQTKRDEAYIITGIPRDEDQGKKETATGLSVIEGRKPESRIVIRTKTWTRPERRFKVLQAFEGTVTCVSGDECWVQIRDITSDEYIVEESSFSLAEISQCDLELVKPGAVFYWSIGYEDSLDGQRKRASGIRFQRIPFWTEEELKKVREESERLSKSIGWTTSPSQNGIRGEGFNAE